MYDQVAKAEGARGQLELDMTVCISWHRGWEIGCEHGGGALARERCTDSRLNQLLPVNTMTKNPGSRVAHYYAQRVVFNLHTVYNNVMVKLE